VEPSDSWFGFNHLLLFGHRGFGCGSYWDGCFGGLEKKKLKRDFSCFELEIFFHWAEIALGSKVIFSSLGGYFFLLSHHFKYSFRRFSFSFSAVS
jgi:hypothetical protein